MKKRPMSAVQSFVAEPAPPQRANQDDDDADEADVEDTEPMSIRERYLQMQKKSEGN